MDKEARKRLAERIERLGNAISECLRQRALSNESERLQKYKEETDQFYNEWERRLREKKE